MATRHCTSPNRRHALSGLRHHRHCKTNKRRGHRPCITSSSRLREEHEERSPSTWTMPSRLCRLRFGPCIVMITEKPYCRQNCFLDLYVVLCPLCYDCGRDVMVGMLFVLSSCRLRFGLRVVMRADKTLWYIFLIWIWLSYMFRQDCGPDLLVGMFFVFFVLSTCRFRCGLCAAMLAFYEF